MTIKDNPRNFTLFREEPTSPGGGAVVADDNPHPAEVGFITADEEPQEDLEHGSMHEGVVRSGRGEPPTGVRRSSRLAVRTRETNLIVKEPRLRLKKNKNKKYESSGEERYGEDSLYPTLPDPEEPKSVKRGNPAPMLAPIFTPPVKKEQESDGSEKLAKRTPLSQRRSRLDKLLRLLDDEDESNSESDAGEERTSKQRKPLMMVDNLSPKDIMNALNCVRAIPALEKGPYIGLLDPRNTAVVEREIMAKVDGLSDVVKYFYIKAQLDADLWSRVRPRTDIPVRQTVEMLWRNVRTECIASVQVEKTQTKWKTLRQHPDEAVETFLARVRKVIEEMRVEGRVPDLVDRVITLKAALRDTELKRWLTLEVDLSIKTNVEEDYSKIERKLMHMSFLLGTVEKRRNTGQTGVQQISSSRGGQRKGGCEHCGLDHDGTCGALNTVCFTCDEVGHLARVCPTRRPRKETQVERTKPEERVFITPRRDPTQNKKATEESDGEESPTMSEIIVEGRNRPRVEVRLPTVDGELKVVALLDTGASEPFIDQKEMRRWQDSGVIMSVTQPDGLHATFGNTASTAITAIVKTQFRIGNRIIPVQCMVTNKLKEKLYIPYNLLCELSTTWTMTPERSTLTFDPIGGGNKPKHNTDCFPSLDEIEVTTGEDFFEVWLERDADAPKGRPTIELPFKDEARPPRAKAAAQKRNERVKQKLNEEQLGMFKHVLNDLVEGGFAVKTTNTSHAEFYIPCFPLFQTSHGSTKCRLVLAAQYINQFLNRGPCLINGGRRSLLGNLMEWRDSKYFAISDVSKAFWRIKVAETSQRYLGTIALGEEYKFVRLPFGLNCAPGGLTSVMEGLIQRWGPEFEEWLNYYIDDLLTTSKKSRAECVERQQMMEKKMAEHGLVINGTKGFNNCDEAKTEDRHYLGYVYDKESDSIGIELGREKPSVKTKAAAVGLLAKKYDPMGIFCEDAMEGKKLLFEVYNSGQDWSESIDDELFSRIEEWTCKDPGWVEREIDMTEIFAFSDASELAWGIDLRDKNLTRIRAKGALWRADEVGPRWTIPRKECVALAYCADLLEEVTKASKTKPTKCTIFSDSKIAIHRVQSENNLEVNPKKGVFEYDAKRLKSARGKIKNRNWQLKHISGDCNPADAISRPGQEPLAKEKIKEGIMCSEEHPLHEKRITLEEIEMDETGGNQHEASSNGNEPELLTTERIKEIQEGLDLRGKPEWKRIDGIVYRMVEIDRGREDYERGEVEVRRQVVIPDHRSDIQDMLVERAHVMVGHRGLQTTVRQLSAKFWFKNLRQRTKNVTLSCQTCMENRGRLHRFSCEINSMPLVPWTCVGVDFMFFGETTMLVLTCLSTKFVALEILKSREISEAINGLLRIFCRVGYPRIVISDNEFSRSRKFTLFCKAAAVQLLHIPAYSSPMAGQWERCHKEIRHIFECVKKHPLKQDEAETSRCSLTEFLYNTTPYDVDSTSSAPITPFALMFGKEPYIPLVSPYEPPKLSDSLIEDRLEGELAETAQKLKKNHDLYMRDFERLWSQQRAKSRQQLLRKKRTSMVEGETVMVFGADKHWRLAVIRAFLGGSTAIVEYHGEEPNKGHEVSLLNLRSMQPHRDTRDNSAGIPETLWNALDL